MDGLDESEVDIQSPSSNKIYVDNRNKKLQNFHETENEHSSTTRKKLKTNRKKNETSFENKLISYLQNRPLPQETDPDKLFLLSLLPQIQKLSQDKKTQLYIYFLNGIQQISQMSKNNNPQTDFHSSHFQEYCPSTSQTPLNVLTDLSLNSHPQLKNINSHYQPPMFSPVPQHYMQNVQFSQATHSPVNLPQNLPYTQTHHSSPPSYPENS